MESPAKSPCLGRCGDSVDGVECCLYRYDAMLKMVQVIPDVLGILLLLCLQTRPYWVVHTGLRIELRILRSAP